MVNGLIWEQVTYYNPRDYIEKMGLPEHPFGLGILEGEESCYLDYFPDHNDPPLTTDSIDEVVTQEEKTAPPGQSSPSQITPTE